MDLGENKCRQWKRAIVLLILCPAAVVLGQVKLPKIFGDHMVVQRELPVHVWGLATPGETITVGFRGETQSTVAGVLGRWSVFLAPGKAGGPFEITVTGSDAVKNATPHPTQTITIEDVLVGDVWLASGQSNMEFFLRGASTAAQDLPHAADPNLRLFHVNRKADQFPQTNIDSDGWAISSPDAASTFSAIAWYFARELERQEHVPMAVIESAWGGTPVQAWTRMAALGSDAALAPVFQIWGKDTERNPGAELEKANQEREITEAKAAFKPAPVFRPQQALESQGPGLLYNGMIAPLTPFPIRGAIWYQGEANANAMRAPFYGRTFRTMIEDWRRQWAIGGFPFLFVQLPNYQAGAGLDWPSIREQQLQALELINTGMAVTIDIGDPKLLHPPDKKDVAIRLALVARSLSYGEQIEYSGPVFRQVTQEGTKLRLWFDHAKGMHAKIEDELTGFEVAGSDGKFVPAAAAIAGANVLVWSPAIVEPVFVRYGWANSPECNLVNSDGLPASPFTSAQ